MNFLDQIERLNKANKLIRSEKTGTPSEFAQKINCSRSQLYIIIDYLKSHNAPIKYCKKRESFYYTNTFQFSVFVQLEILDEQEYKKISGGCAFRPFY
jgi:predicted DNA-binding transcriptional regulator YafY